MASRTVENFIYGNYLTSDAARAGTTFHTVDDGDEGTLVRIRGIISCVALNALSEYCIWAICLKPSATQVTTYPTNPSTIREGDETYFILDSGIFMLKENQSAMIKIDLKTKRILRETDVLEIGYFSNGNTYHRLGVMLRTSILKD